MSYTLSYILGPIFIILFLAISIVSVVGVKYIISALFDKTTFENPPTPKPKRKRKRKPVRSIEINPEEVDRIYVKKSS